MLDKKERFSSNNTEGQIIYQQADDTIADSRRNDCLSLVCKHVFLGLMCTKYMHKNIWSVQESLPFSKFPNVKQH